MLNFPENVEEKKATIIDRTIHGPKRLFCGESVRVSLE